MLRPDEALREIHRALELDPLSLSVNYGEAWVHIEAGRYDEALQQMNKTLEIDPNSAVAHGTLAVAYMNKGPSDEAIKEFHRAQQLRGEYSSYAVEVARVYAIAGRKTMAWKTLHPLLADCKWGLVAPYDFAVTYAALGNKDEAFHWLWRSVDDRSCTLTEINTDRALDALRSDPRFQDLLRRMDFPP